MAANSTSSHRIVYYRKVTLPEPGNLTQRISLKSYSTDAQDLILHPYTNLPKGSRHVENQLDQFEILLVFHLTIKSTYLAEKVHFNFFSGFGSAKLHSKCSKSMGIAFRYTACARSIFYHQPRSIRIWVWIMWKLTFSWTRAGTWAEVYIIWFCVLLKFDLGDIDGFNLPSCFDFSAEYSSHLSGLHNSASSP